jgi:hypothetical protein
MTASLVLPARSRPVPLIAYTAIVAVLAVTGGALAIGAFTAAGSDAGHAAHLAIGEPIATSYGAVTFEHVTVLGGLTSQDLGGVTHGIQNLVLSDQAQVEVSVLVVNRGDQGVRVNPGAFTLLVEGSPDPVELSGSTIRPLTLQPGASVEATLTYVVPQGGARISVAYADPDGEQFLVPAGTLDQAPAVPDGGHTH